MLSAQMVRLVVRLSAWMSGSWCGSLLGRSGLWCGCLLGRLAFGQAVSLTACVDGQAGVETVCLAGCGWLLSAWLASGEAVS